MYFGNFPTKSIVRKIPEIHLIFSSYPTYAYNPKLAAYAINTRIQPVKNLEYITESTPTSMVSGSASASPRPTGIKSHAP